MEAMEGADYNREVVPHRVIPPRILVASSNPKKLAELRPLFEGLPTEVVGPESPLPEVIEDAETFAGNAEKKAREIAAHTGIAKSMGVDDAITNALRDKTALPNARLESLRDFTLALVRERGNLDDATVQTFLDAGFTKRNILEVILGYSQKIMSNYTNHIADTPVDKPFQKFAWVPSV